jgi:hypothetical protein
MSAVAVAVPDPEVASSALVPNICTLAQAKAIAADVLNARAAWEDFYAALHRLPAVDRRTLRASMWPGEVARA